MKKQLFRFASGSLAASLLFCCMSVLAQDQAPSQPAGPGQSGQEQAAGNGRRPMNPDRMLTRMTRRYNLSEDQQNQIKPVLTDEQQQIQSIRDDPAAAPADKRSRMMAIRKDTNAKIELFLTAPQKQKFDQDQARMRDRMSQMGGNGPQDQGQGQGSGSNPPTQ